MRIKRHKIKVKPYRHSSTGQFVVDGIKINGKRKRFFFRTKKEAKTFAEIQRIKLGNEDRHPLQLSDDLRIMTAACAEKLKPYGKTIEEAIAKL